MKEEHIAELLKMSIGDEYKINWYEESGTMIEKTTGGFYLLVCEYGDYSTKEFYREDEVDELVEEAMTYI